MSKKSAKPEQAFSTKVGETSQPKPEMLPEMASDTSDNSTFAAGMPTLEPPEAGIFAQAGLTANAWFNSKKVTGVWVSNDNKNAYVHVNGVGWLKLNDADADSILAIYMIAASARQGSNNVNYRKEADNKIHEIYCW
ncbi:hypothetical protein [Kriegella aquimaris]|uniref:Uncharacterized protein n=1 Tax=Kriegella aquimaris TaxID=192904 RepID=A0A1G9MD29_9FLAO|nr:hypothetical protein [Kriegella aquimaris]SDL72034.1 hypothetical protein SAMN04488514_102470 [Kriegella aquimaris]